MDGAGNCNSGINGNWFYDDRNSEKLEEDSDRSKRSSLSVSGAFWKYL